MESKGLIIETADKKEEFQIDEFGGKFYVFAVSENVLGSRQTKKIGNASTWDGAVELAKLFSGEPVLRIQVKDKC